jgi:2-dehydropantoate 2-reductase
VNIESLREAKEQRGRTPRVAVVGAGAVGGYFGGMLARAGAHVTLIGRPSHVDVWKRDGLVIDGIHVQERIPVEASTDVAASADAELVLFTVKSPDTEETARQLARHVRSDALIVSLQNGVDNVERIRNAAALDPIAAVVYVASSMTAPGRVKHSGRGDLVIGDFPGRLGPARDEAIGYVSNWFETAGVPCRMSRHIDADLWTKLIVNAALNAISAVAQVPYGAVVATPESRETIRHIVNECMAVARADGVPMPDMDYLEMVLRFAQDNGHVYSSTARDLARGARTEIDALNGFVVRRGDSGGVPTPANQSLVAMVKLRETQFERDNVIM